MKKRKHSQINKTDFTRIEEKSIPKIAIIFRIYF